MADREKNFLEKAADWIRPGFEGSLSKPSPTPEEARADEYERIRQQNAERMSGARPSVNLADGGQVSSRFQDLKKIFPDWSDDKIQMMMQKTDHPEQVERRPIPQPEYMNPVRQPVPQASNDLGQNMNDQNQQLQQMGGMQNNVPVQSYKDGGEVESDEDAFNKLAAEEEKEDAKYLTDNTDYAQEDLDAQNKALGDEIPESLDEDDEDSESKDQEPDLSVLMAKNNDKNVEGRRLAGVDNIHKMDGMSLDKKEVLAQNPKMETDDAAGLNATSAIQNLINASKPQGQDLKAAQAERDQNIAAQQIMKGAQLAASGISKTDPSQALKLISENDKYVNLPVQKYDELVKNQQNDPASPMSQALKGYLKSKNVNVPEDASAADLLKVAPFLVKDQAAQNAMQRAILAAQTKLATNQNSVDAANKRASDKNALTRDLLSDKKENTKLVKAQKAENDQNKSLTQTQQLLESARGNPAAAQAEKDLYSTQKANSLANLYGDPNKLSPQQVNLLISEVAKIATGGVPTGHEQEALKPGTPEAGLASLWSKLNNEPSPANAGAFIKQFQDYNKALAKDAQKVIQDKYGRVIETRRKQLGEDNYKNLQDNYINRFKAAESGPPVDADLSKMSPDELKTYIKAHGGQ